MPATIPGTAIAFSGTATEQTYSLISPIIETTGGVSLSQLSQMTGLEGSTVQNWVKRGWVVPSVGKKYGERSVVRILLINILRGALKLDDIAKLMRLVNGEVGDLSDDIMHDTELYNLLCSLIYEVEQKRLQTDEEIRQAVGAKICGGFTQRERAILEKVLFIMVRSALAGSCRAAAESEFENLSFDGGKGGKLDITQ